MSKKLYKVYLFGGTGGSAFAATGVSSGVIRYGNKAGKILDLLNRLKDRLEAAFGEEAVAVKKHDGYVSINLTQEQAREASSWANVSKVLPQ